MQEKRFYDEREAEQILRLASKKSSPASGMSRDQLLSAAAELGISPEAVAEAEREYQLVRHESENRLEYKKHVRQEFFSHLGAYIVINGGLLAFDLFRDGRLSWAMWPVIAWGIGLFFHAWYTFFPGQEQEKEYQKWLRKKERGSAALTSDIEDELLEIDEEFDTEHEKIAAIKELRERTGLSLKEAKDAVDEFNRTKA